MADHQEPTISETGVWVDTATGKVVDSEPEAGRLLVPLGGEVDQRVLDDIAAAKLAAGQTDGPTGVDEPADEAPRRGRPPGSKNKARTADVSDVTDKATEA